MLLCVRGKNVIHLGGQRVVHVLGLLTALVAEVFGIAVEPLLLLVDDPGLAGAVRLTEGSALRLELLGQAFDLVVLGLENIFLGLVLLLQVSKVALAFIGLGDGSLEGNDRDLAGTCR